MNNLIKKLNLRAPDMHIHAIQLTLPLVDHVLCTLSSCLVGIFASHIFMPYI